MTPNRSGKIFGARSFGFLSPRRRSGERTNPHPCGKKQRLACGSARSKRRACLHLQEFHSPLGDESWQHTSSRKHGFYQSQKQTRRLSYGMDKAKERTFQTFCALCAPEPRDDVGRVTPCAPSCGRRAFESVRGAHGVTRPSWLFRSRGNSMGSGCMPRLVGPSLYSRLGVEQQDLGVSGFREESFRPQRNRQIFPRGFSNV